jgi:hypothetical protein
VEAFAIDDSIATGAFHSVSEVLRSDPRSSCMAGVAYSVGRSPCGQAGAEGTPRAVRHNRESQSCWWEDREGTMEHGGWFCFTVYIMTSLRADGLSTHEQEIYIPSSSW